MTAAVAEVYAEGPSGDRRRATGRRTPTSTSPPTSVPTRAGSVRLLDFVLFAMLPMSQLEIAGLPAPRAGHVHRDLRGDVAPPLPRTATAAVDLPAARTVRLDGRVGPAQRPHALPQAAAPGPLRRPRVLRRPRPLLRALHGAGTRDRPAGVSGRVLRRLWRQLRGSAHRTDGRSQRRGLHADGARLHRHGWPQAGRLAKRRAVRTPRRGRPHLLTHLTARRAADHRVEPGRPPALHRAAECCSSPA